MQLKTKITIMVVSVFLISAGIYLAIQRLLIMPSFYRLEREEALQNMGRAMDALDRELQALNTTASDWAYWDDLYDFSEALTRCRYT